MALTIDSVDITTCPTDQTLRGGLAISSRKLISKLPKLTDYATNWRLMYKTPIPTLVVHEGLPVKSLYILVTVDLSSSQGLFTQNLLGTTTRLASVNDANLTILTVWKLNHQLFRRPIWILQMFAIYDTQGLRFRNTLERLRKVQPPTPNPGNQAPSGASQDETEGHSSNNQGRALGGTHNENAVQTYRQTRELSSREPIYHAHQVMSHPVSTLRMDVDIAKAWQHFLERDVRQVPVVNPQQRIVGMLSLEDLLKFVIVDDMQFQYLRGKTVTDAMKPEVLTAYPVTDIRRIAQLMQEYRLHAVPIVDELDALVGIVSRSDLLRMLANNPPLSLWT